MLSDVCFDFNYDVANGKPVKKAAKELLSSVERHSQYDRVIPCMPQQIDALRQAAQAVIAYEKDDDEAKANEIWLVYLAKSVHSFIQAGLADDDAHRFAYRWSKRIRDFEKRERRHERRAAICRQDDPSLIEHQT
jgi:hypothetical protein